MIELSQFMVAAIMRQNVILTDEGTISQNPQDYVSIFVEGYHLDESGHRTDQSAMIRLDGQQLVDFLTKYARFDDEGELLVDADEYGDALIERPIIVKELGTHRD